MLLVQSKHYISQP